MVNQYLICFETRQEANNKFAMTGVRTAIVSKKEQELYLIGHNTNNAVACNFIGQKWTQTSLPFLDLIQDYAFSYFIKSTLIVSIKWMGVPHLRIVLLWIPMLQQVLLALTELQASYLGLHFFGEDLPKTNQWNHFQLFSFSSQLLESSQFLQA